jgi:hypothetical protein
MGLQAKKCDRWTKVAQVCFEANKRTSWMQNETYPKVSSTQENVENIIILISSGILWSHISVAEHHFSLFSLVCWWIVPWNRSWLLVSIFLPDFLPQFVQCYITCCYSIMKYSKFLFHIVPVNIVKLVCWKYVHTKAPHIWLTCYCVVQL